MQRRRNDGLTLIEILLAIAVMVIGIVGLLPMFYAGLDKTKKSVQDTASAVIISSVVDGLTQSMRLDTYTTAEQKKGRNWVNYHHDGVTKDLFFELPHTGLKVGKMPPGFAVEVPKTATVGAPGGAPSGLEVFTLGGATIPGFPLNITATNVDKDQLKTYQFNFTVRPTSRPHLDNVYEFVVRVYRNYRPGAGDNADRLIQEVHHIVAGN